MNVKFRPYKFGDMVCHYKLITNASSANLFIKLISCVSVYFKGSRITTIHEKTCYTLRRTDSDLFYSLNELKIEDRSIITSPDNFQFDYDSVEPSVITDDLPRYDIARNHNDLEYFGYDDLTQEISNSSYFKKPRSDLANAVLNGQLDEVITLLEKYDEINIKNSEGYTLLMLAVMSNNCNMVALLLESGADIEAGNNDVSIDFDENHDALTILDNIDNVNQKESGIYKTPLALAVKEGNCDMVKLLLDKGAKVNSGYSNVDIIPIPFIFDHINERNRHKIYSEKIRGGVPLIMAIKRGSHEIVQMLVKRGANVDFGTALEGAPLSFAIRINCFTIVDFLLENDADVNISSYPEYTTPLSEAIEHENINMILRLLHKKANINSKEKIPPMIRAAKNNNLEIVKILLNQCGIKHGSPEKYAIFAEAAAGNNMEMVKYLISCGAHSYTKYNLKYSALERAIMNSHIDMALYLLQVEIDIRNGENLKHYFKSASRSAIILAAQYGNVEMIKILLELDTEINAGRSHGNNTPIEIAVKGNHLALVKYLLGTGRIDIDDKNPGRPSILTLAAMIGSCPMIHCLLERGAQIDGGFGNPYTPLAYAAQYGHINAICYLLDNGANIHKGTESYHTTWVYDTAIVKAVQNGQRRIVRVLITKELALIADKKETTLLDRVILDEAVRLDHVGIVSDMYETQLFSNLFNSRLIRFAMLTDSYRVMNFLIKIGITVPQSLLISSIPYSDPHRVISPYAYRMRAVSTYNNKCVENLTLLSIRVAVKMIGKKNIDSNILPENLPKNIKYAIKEANY
ncbi:MAG: ankyrin repeat domain-containing protein [Endozoicomonadaceae bacterium]|nr:ankyrin repeat domain-containing protein [Endozoicomonadaceae bacterium]